MDSSTFPILLFLVFGVVAVLSWYLNYVNSNRRREALYMLAMKLRMGYSQDDLGHLRDVYDGYHWTSMGDSREAYNVIAGRLDNWDFKSFDFRYATGSGKNRQVHKITVLTVDTDVRFESLFIRPEGFFDRVAGAVGFDDIDFEGEEFSRKFYVTSPDKKFAYDVLHPRMMELLLRYEGWGLQMFGRTLMLCRQRTLEPSEIEDGMMLAKEFLTLLPDFLWQRLRGT